ncbi:MAG: YlzJ-like protein, partial [Paenibacillus sp.]|nr:YlzJ-like protein [Paenibacillus sp.]
MILYTCMPEEIVFEGWDHIQEQYSELVLDGLLMQVQPISPHQVRIVRLISPNP